MTDSYTSTTSKCQVCSTSADPVHAAIDAHHAAYTKRKLGDDMNIEEANRLDGAEFDAACDLAEIRPTTREGMTRLLRYVAELVARGDERVIAEFGEYDSNKRLSYFVQRNVADALSTMAA